MIRHIFKTLGYAALVLTGDKACAAEPIAPPVLYPADLWQGRSQAIIRILNRTDSHIETLTLPIGGQGQYRSLHLTLKSCVERPITLPFDSAISIETTDEAEPGAHYEGWILAGEPSLSTYRSALYGISAVSCSGDPIDPKLAPLPQPAIPVLTAATPDSVPDQPSNLNNSSHARAGPMQLAPLGEPSHAQPVPTVRPTPARPSSPSQSGGEPIQLAPLSGSAPTSHDLPPPEPNRP